MSDKDYDVVVIGCGSAGSRAAAAAHGEGAKTLALEANEIGGLCILRGCMPTKTLLETAHRLHDIRDAKRFGIDVAEPSVNFPVQMERMRSLVARFKRAKVSGVEGAGYELRRAAGRFVDAHTLEIDGETVSAKAVVIATGSRVRPLAFDLPPELVKDSDDMFLLTEPPKAVVVWGTGAVGLEFAQWLARMGTRVVVVNRSPLLGRTDEEMGKELATALREELTLHACSRVLSAKPCEGGVRVRIRCADGTEEAHEVDWILNATGRIPNIEGLGLDAIGLDEAGVRGVGGDMRTPLEHVFVVGDTNGQRAILHEANVEGRIAGLNAAAVARGEAPAATYDETTPQMSVIFTDPPVATVGRTPQQLLVAGVAFASARKDFPGQGRGIVVGARHGFVRLVAEPGGGAILGCQIFGPRADDLIHIPTAVMRLGGTAKDMATIPWYHPTLAEAFIEVCRGL